MANPSAANKTIKRQKLVGIGLLKMSVGNHLFQTYNYFQMINQLGAEGIQKNNYLQK